MLFMLLLCNNLAVAQYREIYGEHEIYSFQQSDSVYKANKVKARVVYESSDRPGNGKKLLKYNFDLEGRILSIEYEPFIGGQQQTTYFTYNDKGILSGMKDGLVKGEPNKGYMELFSDEKDFQKKVKEIPKYSENSYTLGFSGDTLNGLKKFDSKGELVHFSKFLDDGRQRKVNYLKQNEFITTTYLNNSRYLWLPLTIVSIDKYGKHEKKFKYITNDAGVIIQRIEYLSYGENVYNLIYNEHGLLEAAKNNGYGLYEFKYEFY